MVAQYFVNKTRKYNVFGSFSEKITSLKKRLGNQYHFSCPLPKLHLCTNLVLRMMLFKCNRSHKDHQPILTPMLFFKFELNHIICDHL